MRSLEGAVRTGSAGTHSPVDQQRKGPSHAHLADSARRLCMERESRAAPLLESHLAPVGSGGSRRSLRLAEWIGHTNRSVLLAVREVFRIQDLCP